MTIYQFEPFRGLLDVKELSWSPYSLVKVNGLTGLVQGIRRHARCEFFHKSISYDICCVIL
jgi:hypothetical protein